MMQSADIFHLGADICQLGLDQRRANMLAREVGPKLNWWKPVVVSHHMLMGLGKPPEKTADTEDRVLELKMSKSKPDTAIFMDDTYDEIYQPMNKKVINPNRPGREYLKKNLTNSVARLKAIKSEIENSSDWNFIPPICFCRSCFSNTTNLFVAFLIIFCLFIQSNEKYFVFSHLHLFGDGVWHCAVDVSVSDHLLVAEGAGGHTVPGHDRQMPLDRAGGGLLGGGVGLGSPVICGGRISGRAGVTGVRQALLLAVLGADLPGMIVPGRVWPWQTVGGKTQPSRDQPSPPDHYHRYQHRQLLL
jgi:hypothetical protein